MRLLTSNIMFCNIHYYTIMPLTDRDLLHTNR